jgi:hypothetical protein
MQKRTRRGEMSKPSSAHHGDELRIDRRGPVVLGNAVIRRVLSIALLVICVVGCGTPAPSGGPIRALGPGERWLPVAEWGPTQACGGVGYPGDVRLHGSPDDLRIVWMTWSDGSRREIGWDLGTSARFNPTLEVIGPDGIVVAREGSFVTGGCGTGETNVSYVDFTTPRPDATDVPVDGPVR